MRRLLTTALLATALAGSTAAPAFAQTRDRDCKDFPSQAAAQAFLNADPSDPSELDANNNGQACENFMSFRSAPVKAGAPAKAAAPAKASTVKAPAAKSSKVKTAELPRTGPRETVIMGTTGTSLVLLGAVALYFGRRRTVEA